MGITKMLSYVMAQKVVESFKLVEILVAILTACRQCQLCVHLLSGIRKLPSLGGLQAVCFNFDTEWMANFWHPNVGVKQQWNIFCGLLLKGFRLFLSMTAVCLHSPFIGTA